MQAFLDWLKSTVEFISNTTAAQRSVLLVFIILTIFGYLAYKSEKENEELMAENRVHMIQSNYILNNIKDSFNIEINKIRDECRKEKIIFLEEKLQELKELEKETKKALINQNKIIKSINQ
jgi:glycine cleavage system protein P-like pyridoxal-binding family